MVEKIRKNSKGFGIVELLIILLVIGLLGFGGWYVYHSREDKAASKDKNESRVEQANQQQTLDKKYSDITGNFSVMHPSTWEVQTATNNSDPDLPSTTTTLTSPAGTVLKLNSDWGGRGGGCEPAADDEPFKAGNACPTIEYLSSEKVSIENIYYAAEEVVSSEGVVTKYIYKPGTIVLTTSHYADREGKSIYMVGLRESNPPRPIVINQPEMGFVIPEQFFAVNDVSGHGNYPSIYAYATGTGASFLQSEDVATIKTILRTVKVDL